MKDSCVAVESLGFANYSEPNKQVHSTRKRTMKKLLAMMAVVVLMTASGVAQTPGNVPVFTNSAGAVGNSVIFQSSGDIGIGTTTPAATLHVVSTSTAAGIVDVYSNALTGVTFSTRSARGTPTSPLPVQTGDVIGGFTGKGWMGSGGFSGGRGALIIHANETWSSTAQSTYMQFNTTALGTAAQAERMRIDNAGNVGIGTSTPDSLLTVAGTIHTTGGIKFPDNTTQTTAAGGVALSSPDGSVTVGGTAAAPTVAVNTAKIQPLLTGTCASGSAMTGVSASGSVVCGTIGPGGATANIPVIVANTSFTGSYGLGASNTIYTATADGFYRVTVYMNVPTTGTCGTAPCAGEAITVQWNDGVSTTALATANCNLVTPCGSSAVTPVWVKSGQAITAYGQSYGTGTSPSGGSYNAYVLVEQL